MAPTPGMNRPARAGGFNAYAAGDKVYGGGRSFPNSGPTSDPTGYRERNLQIKARQNAILSRMKKNASSIRPNNQHNDYISRNNDGTGTLRGPSTVAGGGTGGN